MADYKAFPPKDPAAELDYLFDWAALKNHNGLTNWLREDETIVSYTLVVEPEDGVVVFSDELINDNTSVLVWIKEGEVDTEYKITCNMVTSNNPPRKDTRSATLLVESR